MSHRYRYSQAPRQGSTSDRPTHRTQKKLIEQAYQVGEELGISVWTEDEAGPFQTMPYPGSSWQPEGEPAHQPHEYQRNGTAKMLTLFHPSSGQARVKGVRRSTNQELHSWLKAELSEVLAALPPPCEEMVQMSSEGRRELWESWREGLSVRATLCGCVRNYLP